jgi:hypothetical protein
MAQLFDTGHKVKGMAAVSGTRAEDGMPVAVMTTGVHRLAFKEALTAKGVVSGGMVAFRNLKPAATLGTMPGRMEDGFMKKFPVVYAFDGTSSVEPESGVSAPACREVRGGGRRGRRVSVAAASRSDVPVLTCPRFPQLVPMTPDPNCYGDFRYGTFFLAFLEPAQTFSFSVTRRCVQVHRLSAGTKAMACTLTVNRSQKGLSHAASVVMGAAPLHTTAASTDFDNDVFAVLNARADLKSGERRVQPAVGGSVMAGETVPCRSR